MSFSSVTRSAMEFCKKTIQVESCKTHLSKIRTRSFNINRRKCFSLHEICNSKPTLNTANMRGDYSPGFRIKVCKPEIANERRYKQFFTTTINNASLLKLIGQLSVQCLVLLIIVASTPVGGQRAPCYECEQYFNDHPDADSYNQIRARCEYPCSCQEASPSTCPQGEALVSDPCGCCWKCQQVSQDLDKWSTPLENSEVEPFFEKLIASNSDAFKSSTDNASDDDREEYDYEADWPEDDDLITASSSIAETKKSDTANTISTKGRPNIPTAFTGSFLRDTGQEKDEILCGPYSSCQLGLTCIYSQPGVTGTCKETKSVPCLVNDTSYSDGSTFRPDCRTECSCSGGQYACVSLCPDEEVLPSPQCKNPRLVEGSNTSPCCRQWVCDGNSDLKEPRGDCEPTVSRWSACSSLSCGLGLSERWATDPVSCRPALQTRLCQLRPCFPLSLQTPVRQIRRGRHCKATIRAEQSLRLVAGPCVSQKKYRPKQCNTCAGSCCASHHDTSLDVVFICPLHSVPSYLLSDGALSATEHSSMFDVVTDSDTLRSRIGDLTDESDEAYRNVSSSNYEVVHKKVQWITHCMCTPSCATPTIDPLVADDNEQQFLIIDGSS